MRDNQIVSCVLVKLISHVTVYRRLMAVIKSQYEQVISVLEHAHEERLYLSGNMMALMSTPATLSNYQCRTQDLHNKYNTYHSSHSRENFGIGSLVCLASVPFSF